MERIKEYFDILKRESIALDEICTVSKFLRRKLSVNYVEYQSLALQYFFKIKQFLFSTAI